MSIRWKNPHEDDMAFTRADIMRARADIMRARAEPPAPRHAFDPDAPFANLVETIDALDHTDPKKRWKVA